MTIPAAHVNRFTYHFSHIDNLAGLISNGFLATNHELFPRTHRSIAASSIQQRRSEMQVTCGPKGVVHDYVPLYFGSLSPMLLSVLNAKNVDQQDIIYFEFPIELVNRCDVVFTSASANTKIPPTFFSSPEDLKLLDWGAIDSLKWGNPDDDYRHRRMAEMLVYQHLPVTAAARCVVWNENIKNRVLAIVGSSPFPEICYESRLRRHFYNNIELNDNSSLVIGPKGIREIFENTYNCVVQSSGTEISEEPEFETMAQLLRGLRENFGCISHTAELIELKSENGVHKLTVDKHTKQVVEKLLKLPDFRDFDHRDKNIVELAAYLHDIGKGPRARWDRYGGLQKVDPNHPVGAMPMIADILTKNIRVIRSSDARSLIKLVCYHDLVGDVLGRNRDRRQIIEIAENISDLKMLFALGKADATSLSERWWDQTAADELYQYCLEQI